MTKTNAAAATMLGLALALAGAPASAHCDSLDGPVVRDAQAALERGDVTPTLKWVRAEDEAAVREAFARTLAVRGGGDAARQLADRFFFETLVRIHRAGEGEGFTGLKPAGSTDPGIAAADQALTEGSGKALARDLGAAAEAAVRRRFEAAQVRRRHAADSLEAGRAYVEAYVDYVHFVETLHGLGARGADHHHAGHE